MHYSPAPHHLAGIDWLISKPFAALWLDMGGGKTGITATVIDRLLDQVEVKRTLVVATPRVAAGVWFKEFEKWDHLGYLAKRSYHITSEDLTSAKVKVIRAGKEVQVSKLVNPRQLRYTLNGKLSAVNTIHFDMLPRLVKLYGDDWPFDCVILDESSMVSNQDTARFRALRRIRGSVARFYELTGTPTANGLEKLFSQVYLMDGGKRLGRTLSSFREMFMMPNKVDQSSGRVYTWQPRPFAREAIYEAVRDICLSIDPGDWANLPERIINPIYVKLPPKAQALYDRVERDYIAVLNGQVIEAATAAVLGNKLLQICNGVVYDDQGESVEVHNVKLEALQELREVTNGPILLAYWYDHDRQRLRASNRDAVDLADDPKFEDRWNAGEIELGMLQPASGGHGLNLQDGGSVACWYGPIYNLELWLQFNKRLHRPGQKADRVVINVLVAEGTIEEDVLAVLDLKEEEQDALLLAVRRRVDKLTGKVA